MQHLRNILFIALTLFFSSVSAQLINQIVPINRMVSGDVASGYIFITPMTLDSIGAYPTSLCILDSVGNHVFFKPFTDQVTGPYIPSFVSDFKIQPSGLFSFSSRLAGGGMGMYLLDNDFNIVDSIRCSPGVATDGHDFIHLAEGSYHLVGTEERMMDLSGMNTIDGTPGDENATVTGNVIQRFDAQKKLQFEWRSLDYFAISDVYDYYFVDPGELDHSHYNSLDIDGDGNYILSFRHLNEITKIDASTGQIIWRLGGKQNQFSFLGDTMRFSAQHDARRIANGNLTLFDNGVYNSIPVARAIEYELDEVNMTATAAWQFKEPNGLSSTFIGNADRQSNGNTLVDWGGAFPLSVSTSFTEVDAEGNMVMKLDLDSDRYVSYRSVKQELPFPIYRPQLSCDGEAMTLTAPDGFTTYEWNTGATSQSITVVDTGTYQVWVKLGIGYVSSEEYHVSDLDSLCHPTGIAEMTVSKIRIYPIPVSNTLYVEYSGSRIESVDIIGSAGQLMEEIAVTFDGNRARIAIDVSRLPTGIYYLKIGNAGKKFIKVH